MNHILEIFIVVSIFIVIMGLFAWALITSRKQVVKDWATLEDLQSRYKKLSTIEEVEAFHEEFREKSSKIHNQFINPKLEHIDGYLRGLHKKLSERQMEKLYTEEEVLELLQKYRLDLSSGATPNIGDTTKVWFQQFKKK
jgi:hypothetical protein